MEREETLVGLAAWRDFEERNREAFEDAEFYRRTRIRKHQSRRWIGKGLSIAGLHIGQGIAWFGFWIAVATVCAALIMHAA